MNPKIQRLIGVVLIYAVVVAVRAEETVVEIGNKELVSDCIPLGCNLFGNEGGTEKALKQPVLVNFEGYLYRDIFNGVLQPDGFRTFVPTKEANAERQERVEKMKTLGIGTTAYLLSGPAKGQKRTVVGVEVRAGFTQYNKGTGEFLFLKFDKPLEGVTEQVPKASDEVAMGLLLEKERLSEGSLTSVRNAERLTKEMYSFVHEDLPPGTTGKTALKLNPVAKGGTLEFAAHSPMHTDCNRVYTLSFWGKAAGKGAKVAASMVLAQKTLTSTKVELSDTWKKYSVPLDLTGKVDNKVKLEGWTWLLLSIGASDASILIDEIELRGEGYKNPTPFVDEVVEQLKLYGPGVIRSIRVDGAGLDTHLLAPMQQVIATRSLDGSGRAETRRPLIAEFLPLCEYLGCEAWYNLPGTIRADEIDLFLEYVGAPSDVGYGKMRAAQGHPEPWLKTLKKLHVEIGNEVWNFGGGYNGPDFWNDMFGRAKKSPYYQPNLLFRAAGMQSGNMNLRIMKDTPNADRFAIAPYIAHFYPKNIREACPTPEDRARWLVGLGLAKNIYSKTMTDQIKIGRDANIRFCLYEMNHHLVSLEGDGGQRFGGRPKATADLINEYDPSQIAGVALANNMLAMLREHSIREQCFWCYAGNFYNIKLWGGVERSIGEPRCRPTWLALMAANRAILPKMLETKMSGARPVFTMPALQERSLGDMPALKGLGKGEEYASLWSYAFAEGAERSLILCNVDVAKEAVVKVRLSSKPVGGAKVWRLTGPGAYANNELENGDPKVFLKESELAGFADGSVLTLPPASLIALRWKIAAQ